MFRQALWAEGIRYRVDYGKLPGRPDIAIVRDRMAVFVDGDFWHGRDWEMRKRKLASGHNAEYWVQKIARNMRRDEQVNTELMDLGWDVVRVWEGDLRRDLAGTVKPVIARIRAGRQGEPEVLPQ